MRPGAVGEVPAKQIDLSENYNLPSHNSLMLRIDHFITGSVLSMSYLMMTYFFLEVMFEQMQYLMLVWLSG